MNMPAVKHRKAETVTEHPEGPAKAGERLYFKCIASVRTRRRARKCERFIGSISFSDLQITQLRFLFIESNRYIHVMETADRRFASIQQEETMKVWSKPAVREQEVGLEVTSYMPAEIDII